MPVDSRVFVVCVFILYSITIMWPLLSVDIPLLGAVRLFANVHLIEFNSVYKVVLGSGHLARIHAPASARPAPPILAKVLGNSSSR